MNIKEHEGCDCRTGTVKPLRPKTFANSTSQITYGVRCDKCNTEAFVDSPDE